MARRLALLGGSAAAAASAFGLQVARLRFDPNGAAVHGVSLFVNLVVLAILLWLLRLHISGPGLQSPSWDRRAHRASMREAPLVALVGTAVAMLLALATPRLVLEDGPSSPSPSVVMVPETELPAAAPAPVRTSKGPAVAAPDSKPFARAPSPDLAMPPADGGVLEQHRPVHVSFQDRTQEGESTRTLFQDPVDPTRSARDTILRLEPGEPPLPPMRISLGALFAMASGDVGLAGSSGRFMVDVETVRGSSTFEPGVDLGAEFSLTADSALKIMYAGMAIASRGRFGADTELGSATAPAGSSFEFEMTWSHLYAALAKRLAGYAPDTWFDLSVHAGAMIDHTLTEFESHASGVGAESEDGERGWLALGAGFSLAIRGPAPAGFVLEVVQSAPLNLGGQAIGMTDVRAGVTADVFPGATLFFGYRYMKAVYRLFDEPLVREGGQRTADLFVRGPVLGFDFQF